MRSGNILLLVFCFLLVPLVAMAQEESEPGLTVFPFEINAGEDLAYLNETLPVLLSEKLEEFGFQTSPQEEITRLISEQGVQFLDLQTVKDLTLLLRGRYGVYGSFSQAGETISIDARLVDGLGLNEPTSHFVVKEGVIGLLPAVDELAQSIRREIQQEDRIVSIEVAGNDILEKDVIFMRLSSQSGDIFAPKRVNEDVRRLYELGYFEDVQVEVEDVQGGKRLIFRVEEKPLIQAIGVTGADAVKEDDIVAAMSTKTGSVLNLKILSDDLEAIRQLYRKEGYYNASVDYDLEQTDPRRARLNLTVDEGQKLYIKDVKIIGAEKMDESDLKGELALQERGLFSWITGRGVLKEELLDRDAAALEAYYGNRGFFDVQVGQPEVAFEEDGIVVTFKVVEGERYTIGNVSYGGDLLEEPERLREITRLDDLAEKGEYFDRSVLRSDSQRLADYYTNFGYAFAETDVDLNKNEANRTIDVTYVMRKEHRVYIRRVLIEGNTKTRDNIIRRELRLGDGDLFGGYKLSRSNQRLTKLDYFESVNIETVPTQSPTEMDLRVSVKEKPTGMLSLAAGFSTLESFFVSAKIQERNLFGKGYNLGVQGTIGGTTTNYTISFWNPQLYDSNLGIGTTLYLTEQDYDEYDKDSFGGSLRFAYPLGEYTKLLWSYRLEQYELSNIEEEATDRIRDFEGTNLASSVKTSVTRDTTNRVFNPSRGSINTLSVEYAGGLIGGDDNFVKYLADSSVYYPLFWKAVFHWHGHAGFVHDNTGDDLIPPFERFHLGGINSIRGYEAREISPVDELGEKFGGNKAFFTNFEMLFPLSEDLGLVGLAFFDAGDTWDEGEEVSLDLYKSVGVGIRWYSPLGPLRFEYGYPLDELNGEQEGKFEFSVGQFF
ncbi:MAG: outer membrane protein assembly factor BamA [Desulfovibrionales bacterium]